MPRDDLARRFGTEMAVVFDGSDVIGAHSAAAAAWCECGTRRGRHRRRRDPGGGRRCHTSRAVVVVTNDGAVRRDAAAAGANTVSSDAFLDVALR